MIGQNHKCAFLGDDGILCFGSEDCQHKLTTACRPLGQMICGKDQILELEYEAGVDR